MIPPEADGEFAARMEVVLDTYALPYDCRYPVLNMDEQPNSVRHGICCQCEAGVRPRRS